MARPRIEGMDEKIINSFLERQIFSNQKEVIAAALRALVREQKVKEAMEREEQLYEDETYSSQLEVERESKNAPVGHVVRSPATR